MRTLAVLDGCIGFSESVLVTQVLLSVLSCIGLNISMDAICGPMKTLRQRLRSGLTQRPPSSSIMG